MYLKKRGKKVVASVLACGMAFSLSGGVMAADISSYPDVPQTHWAYQEVSEMLDKGIFNGTSANTFSPEKKMTRAMFVVVLSRMAGIEVDNSASKFEDVPADTWYTGAVNWAAEKEIVLGTSETKFSPEQEVTREEMATLIARYAKALGITLPESVEEQVFSDADKIQSFAKEAVLICQRAELLNGMEENKFNPQGGSTRAQGATILSRLTKLEESKQEFTVSFESNGGSEIADQVVREGNLVLEPDAPTMEGSVFDGWFSDEELKQKYDFNTPVQGNITLYAKWTAEEEETPVEFKAPEIAEAGELTGSIIDGYQADEFTYPQSITAEKSENGDAIVLSLTGEYELRQSITGFPASPYDNGYVVPLKFYAPSNYDGGDVNLKLEGGIEDTDNKVTPQDGGYLYVFYYIPSEEYMEDNDWNPTITINWNGTEVVYQLDVSAMTLKTVQ